MMAWQTYLTSVLGVREVMWRESKVVDAYKTRLRVWGEPPSSSENELFLKILSAIRLSPEHVEFLKASPLTGAPIVIFGKNSWMEFHNECLKSESNFNFDLQRGNLQSLTLKEPPTEVIVMQTHSLADLIHTPELKKEAWQDLQKLRNLLESNVS